MTTPNSNEQRPKVVIKRKKPAAGAQKAPEQAPAETEAISRQDIDALTRLADYAQRLNLAEYMKLTQRPRRLIGLNFVVGVARGFGIAVGFTLLGAVGVYVMQQLQVLNIPLIGNFIAQILEYVEAARGMRV